MSQTTSIPQFKLVAASYPAVDSNTVSVTVDFVKKSIHLIVQQTSDADSFNQAVAFAATPFFDIEASDGKGNIYFAVKPLGLNLADHQLKLSPTDPLNARHLFMFTYTDLATGTPVATPVATDPNFPTPAEVVQKLRDPQVMPLDLTQEMRLTPDHPDTDGNA